MLTNFKIGIRKNLKIPFCDVEVTEPLVQSAKAGARAGSPRH